MIRAEFFRCLNESTERIRVYRLGTNPTLDNRNAGTLAMVVGYIRDVVIFGPNNFGDSIYVYDVDVELPYGEYLPYNGAQPSRYDTAKQAMGLVGKNKSYNLTGNPAYSFPAGSSKWRATLVKRMSLQSFVVKADTLVPTEGGWLEAPLDVAVRVAQQVLGV